MKFWQNPPYSVPKFHLSVTKTVRGNADKTMHLVPTQSAIKLREQTL
ncbi:MAG: hypothetical protein GY749_24065 [Desulfobacteraceae bacterium]|nr:hypothetical protein [Desulfobacteraceae bacterium]